MASRQKGRIRRVPTVFVYQPDSHLRESCIGDLHERDLEKSGVLKFGFVRGAKESSVSESQ